MGKSPEVGSLTEKLLRAALALLGVVAAGSIIRSGFIAAARRRPSVVRKDIVDDGQVIAWLRHQRFLSSRTAWIELGTSNYP